VISHGRIKSFGSVIYFSISAVPWRPLLVYIVQKRSILCTVARQRLIHKAITMRRHIDQCDCTYIHKAGFTPKQQETGDKR
jgi:hypothetical protein